MNEKVWKWWKRRKKKRINKDIKWKTLQHNGPVFAPDYEKVPTYVKFYYDGRAMHLRKEVEEVAGFYGKMLEEVYTKKEKFNENFFADWQQIMTPTERDEISQFKKCDFWDFYNYYKDMAENRRIMTPNEIMEKKIEAEAEKANYGYCLMDGYRQRINNYKLEPPGLFRGRGTHPKMGKLKKRVEAEDITINIGKDIPVPKPPPGHKWKNVIHDNKVCWLARWIDSINGHYKYMLLNPSSKIKGQDEIEKFQTARQLKRHLPSIRRKYTRDFSASNMLNKQRAVALYFIDRLALRTGNEKDMETADTVGCCSLRVEHIALDQKEGIIRFNFLGKDSIRFKRSLRVDERVFWNLQHFMEGKSRKSKLFDLLSPSKLNRYLNEIMEGLTAKVFRTYYASMEQQTQLRRLTKRWMSLDRKLQVYNRANRAAAVICNHHRAVSKTFAKSLKNLQKKMKLKAEHIKQLTKEMKRKDGCEILKDKQKRKMSLLRKQLQKLNIRTFVKKENKDIALATSKLSYLDPRISVAWCKKWHVPIEKVYNKSQRERFQWAIETTSKNFKF